MKFNHSVLLLCLLAPSLVMAQGGGKGDSASDQDTPHFGPLNPEQIQAVQSVGRSVLGAKSGLQNDAEAEALKQELQVLSDEIDQATSVKQPPPIAPPGKEPAVQGKPISARADDDAKLRNRAGKLEQRRVQMLNASRQRGSEEGNLRAEGMSGKAAELAQELSATLAATDSERFARLIALRQRLQPQSLNEVLENQRVARNLSGAGGTAQPEDETPTLSTIVKHR